MYKLVCTALLMALAVAFESGCATKKYVRNRVSERVTPLEQRTGELEETSRRSSQDLARLSTDVTDVRGRADRAQSQADAALSRAEQANTRVTGAEQSVNDLRTNLDNYSVQTTSVVHFKLNKYDLTPEGKESLDQLPSQIK